MSWRFGGPGGTQTDKVRSLTHHEFFHWRSWDFGPMRADLMDIY